MGLIRAEAAPEEDQEAPRGFTASRWAASLPPLARAAFSGGCPGTSHAHRSEPSGRRRPQPRGHTLDESGHNRGNTSGVTPLVSAASGASARGLVAAPPDGAREGGHPPRKRSQPTQHLGCDPTCVRPAPWSVGPRLVAAPAWPGAARPSLSASSLSGAARGDASPTCAESPADFPCAPSQGGRCLHPPWSAEVSSHDLREARRPIRGAGAAGAPTADVPRRRRRGWAHAHRAGRCAGARTRSRRMTIATALAASVDGNGGSRKPAASGGPECVAPARRVKRRIGHSGGTVIPEYGD
jgi:hypothetical protein